MIVLDAQQARSQFDSKRKLALPFSQLKHVDYGYCSTSHAAQGATVDRVVVNADSMRSAQLVNRKQFYVSISRARNDARVYTDDAQALRRAVVREPKKQIAPDAVKQRPTQELKPTRETTELLSAAISDPVHRNADLKWSAEALPQARLRRPQDRAKDERAAGGSGA